MAQSSARPEGFWRALQLLVSPFAFVAKVAAAVFLILAMIAGGLIWQLSAMLSSPRNQPEPSAEARNLISRLANVAPFQGMTPKESCRRPLSEALATTLTESCVFDFGKASVRVSWYRPTGEVWSASLKTSIPDEQRTAYQSAPLGWLDFSAIHGIFCPKNSDAAVVITTLPQRLARMPWSRWDGGKTVPATPDDLGATRSVDAAKDEFCKVSLTETRDRNQIQVTLSYGGRNFRDL
jgi:hypothetical protein